MESRKSDRECTGALQGVRVVELGGFIAGPFAARMLADHGAEVLKVESPRGGGDPLRYWATTPYDGMSLWWFMQSRNKKLLTLDLHKTAGQELLQRLLGVSDVLVENFRPGTLEQWGLAPETLLENNPRLVIARVSGYGQSGPYRSRPGFAAGAEAMSSLRYVNGFPGQAPPRAGVAIGDSVTSYLAVAGIVMALYHRERSGRGQVVDASILESCVATLDGIVPEYGSLGTVRQPSGTGMEHAAPSNIFSTKDGKWLVVAATADRLFHALCLAIGRDDLASDPVLATNEGRVKARPQLEEAIGRWVAMRTLAEAEAALLDAGVVTTPINNVADLAADPHVREREVLTRVPTEEAGEVLMSNVVPRLSDTPGAIRWAGPWEKGADNEAVYHDLLGLSEDEIADLRSQEVI